PVAAAVPTPVAVVPAEPKRVYLFNTPRYHYEVMLPLLSLFTGLENVNVELFCGRNGWQRFGVRPLMDYYANDNLQLTECYNNDCKALRQRVKEPYFSPPEVIYLTTCPEDMDVLDDLLLWFLAGGTHVICTVHESQKWNLNVPAHEELSPYQKQINFMIPWIKRGQWHLATLSEHVQKYVHNNFPTYFQTGSEVEYNPLLFYPTSRPTFKSDISIRQDPAFVAIVGKLEPWRRNYDAIFKQYIEFNPPLALELIGNAGLVLPKVPASIKDNVTFVSGLEFPEYFQEIAEAVAIVPSFANDFYIHSQASSSIATSVTVGTPPLLTQEMLDAYAYVPENAAWIQLDNETEVEAVARIADLGPAVWKEHKQSMQTVRGELIQRNLALFQSFM
ncbi:uncharacterized protein V1516DRAFT_614383, partial [Lipomyces oligophaga]|uniref:uncharacterized protein n=1 Tax=Lipomyces oligophaga TaxID=45792 RepID=UPI0034CFDCBE